MSRPRFRQIAHTADARLAVWGDSAAELLGNAVAGALRVALGRTPAGAAHCWRPVAPWPHSLDEQIVRTVNEALFLLYSRREVTVAVRSTRRGASLGTDQLPPGQHPETEIKAATFHALRATWGQRNAVVLTLDL